MNPKYFLLIIFHFVLIIYSPFDSIAQKKTASNNLSSQLMAISSQSSWQMTDSIKLKFNAFHTQGMIKVGDYFYLSSVEIQQPTKRYSFPQNGYDRDTGKGVGHVFKIDKNGQLIKDIVVGEGDVYHPGGIDFDGKYIWVAVAEYRPNSRSIFYRIPIDTEEVETLFSFQDHIGAVVVNNEKNKLIAASWGAEKLYTLKLKNRMKSSIRKSRMTPNRFRYIDYQDSQYAGDGMMFGSGIKHYTHPDGTRYTLGGWQLTELKTMHSVWQLPVTGFSSATGQSLVQNPCFIEPHNEGIKAWLAPDDDLHTVIYGFYISK